MYKLFRIINTYKDFFIFAALLIICFSLISTNSTNQIGGFRSIVAVTFGSLRNLFSWFPDVSSLRTENKELTSMNTQFFTEVVAMRKAISENNELRAMLDMKKTYQYPLVAADVYDKSSIQLRNYVVLNKGKSVGISIGMPVISLKGLIGTVIGCSNNYSVVEAINSKNVKIPAFTSKSKLNGIVTWNDDYYLQMLYIPISLKVEVGEEIYTSILNSKYPEDILIGKIYKVVKESGSHFYKIIIKPANPFFEYRQLFVVKHIKDIEEIKLIEQVENRLLELNKSKK